MVDGHVRVATYFAAIVKTILALISNDAKRKEIVKAQVSSPYQPSGISETLSENESDLLI